MISILWRILVVISGAAVVAAATHANIEHAGGYGSDESWIIIAIAVLLALGMAYAAICWRERRFFGAIALGLCLLAGEVYWLATNAEREIANREDQAAPALMAKAKYETAKQRVADALEAKKKADDAAISEAAKPGCKKNCADLLTAAKASAAKELEEARGALAVLPEPKSSAPLPERLGLQPWAWDLVMACLRSLAVIGGSIAIGLALHGRHETKHQGEAAASAPVEFQSPPQPARTATVKALHQIEPPKLDEREHVAQFLRATLRPDPEGTASLRKLHGEYLEWCRARTLDPLPAPELGKQLRVIVDAIGLEVEPLGQDVVVRGAAIAA